MLEIREVEIYENNNFSNCIIYNATKEFYKCSFVNVKFYGFTYIFNDCTFDIKTWYNLIKSKSIMKENNKIKYEDNQFDNIQTTTQELIEERFERMFYHRIDNFIEVRHFKDEQDFAWKDILKEFCRKNNYELLIGKYKKNDSKKYKKIFFRKKKDYIRSNNSLNDCLLNKTNIIINNKIIKDIKKHQKIENNSNKTLFGFELEVGSNYDSIQYYIEYLKNIYNKCFLFKKDYSIKAENQMEIVSTPSTLNESINQYKILYTYLYDFIKESNEDENNYNCGGHIHMSFPINKDKNYIKENSIKLIDLFYKNQEKITIINERKAIYNKFTKKDNISESSDSFLGIKNKNRYSQLNFTDKTIEFRGFGIPLNENSIVCKYYFMIACRDFILNGDEAKWIESLNKLVIKIQGGNM